MTIHSDDTLQSCLNRLLHSGDFNEPLAQYLAEILQHFGAGPPAPTGVPEAPTDSQLYGRENAGWQVVPTGGTDPAAVRKTGDTMTGQLVVKGDQFDGDPPAQGAFLITNAAGTDKAGIAIGKWGSLTIVGTNPGLNLVNAGIQLYDGAGNRLALNADPFCVTFAGGSGKTNITLSNSRNWVSLINNGPDIGIAFDLTGPGGPLTVLKMDSTTGDIIATSTAGPNAGKSVNLTAGKWA